MARRKVALAVCWAVENCGFRLISIVRDLELSDWSQQEQ